MQEEQGCKPQIQYPCRWQYRVIGEDKAAMEQAILSQVNPEESVITEGNVSSGGRYISLTVEMTVFDEAQRLLVYNLLAAHPSVRMVL